MAQNIEIKARLSDPQFDRIAELAQARATRSPEWLQQRDTFFRAASGRLKLRELGGGTAELIAYDRPDQAGPKLSSYVVVPIADPRALHEVLSRSLGVRGIVEKHRQVIHIEQTRVHLDEVEGLGRFIELEVVLLEQDDHQSGTEIAAELMAWFGVDHRALIEGAYIDLLEAASR